MTIAYACNYMYIMNFGDEIILRGEECKTREKMNFSKKKGQNNDLSIPYRLKTWNFSR